MFAKDYIFGFNKTFKTFGYSKQDYSSHKIYHVAN